ncbi:unnamed protein product [Lymnaea stagnalis]|uniref:Nitrate/nitrite sensing protein domain-containing protein n=1 Tax=Lymnaea stagnalis TaxID=6523 RepID=A0AAV2IE59_LYMST
MTTTTPLSSFLTASTCSTTTLTSSIFGDSGQKKSFLDRTLNFRTSIGRYFLLVLILTAGFIPAVILLAQNIVIVFKAVKNLDKNNLVQTNIESALLIKDLLHDIQLERGHSALYLSSDGEIRTRDDMLRSRLNVDDIFMALKSWPRSLLSYPGTVPNKTAVRVDLMTFRHSIDTRVVDEYGVVQFYSQIIDLLIKWMQELMNAITLGNFWPEIVAFQALTFATENAGLERANGAIFFTKGKKKKNC